MLFNLLLNYMSASMIKLAFRTNVIITAIILAKNSFQNALVTQGTWKNQELKQMHLPACRTSDQVQALKSAHPSSSAVLSYIYIENLSAAMYDKLSPYIAVRVLIPHAG